MTQTKANIISVFIIIKTQKKNVSENGGSNGKLRKYFENYFKAILTVNRKTHTQNGYV